MALTHFDEARSFELDLGHLRGRWTALGAAAGSVGVGVQRIQLPAGGWSTPAHQHGRSEEIFYVLSGSGLSWEAGETAEIGADDCIVYVPNRGPHTLHATEPLDVLAFGPREYDEAMGFPRLGMSLLGRRAVVSEPAAVDGRPFQFARESKLGPPELPEEPGPRPATIVNVDAVEGVPFGRGGVEAVRRDVGRAAGSRVTGLKHVSVAPSKYAAPLHCHSLEEELFVVLAGEGTLLLGDEELALRPGSVIARPPGTGVAHSLRAGGQRLEFLAYGTREPGDMCYYPRSNKISFRGLGVIGRVERLSYWDGEE
ncbi:MAG TPA: cupin domain-containing protein [Solirubrobacteraceae bacterium]